MPERGLAERQTLSTAPGRQPLLARIDSRPSYWRLHACLPCGFCAGVKGLASRSSGRYLASSKSSPNLLVPSADTVCVLGKECRSRRRIATADNDASGPPASLAELKGAHSPIPAQYEGSRQA